MTDAFRGSELMKLAAQMELNGQTFYTKAAARMKDPRTREIFIQLARDEEEHAVIFTEMLAKLEATRGARPVRPISETVPDEYAAYLKAYADAQVFTAERLHALLAHPDLDERVAIQFGIDSERDAILFYADLKESTPVEEHKPINKIIHEERRHFTELVRLEKECAARSSR